MARTAALIARIQRDPQRKYLKRAARRIDRHASRTRLRKIRKA